MDNDNGFYFLGKQATVRYTDLAILEASASSRGGSKLCRRRQQVPEAMAASSGGDGSKLCRQQQALHEATIFGGGSKL